MAARGNREIVEIINKCGWSTKKGQKKSTKCSIKANFTGKSYYVVKFANGSIFKKKKTLT